MKVPSAICCSKFKNLIFLKKWSENCKNYIAATYVNDQVLKYVTIQIQEKEKKYILKLVFTWKQNFKNVKRLSP